MTFASEVIVVGSGASGVQAAAALLDAGRTVCMLDVGDHDPRYVAGIGARAFAELRRTDRTQHHYMLGEDFEGVDLGKTGPIAQVTPPRQFVFRRAINLLKTSGTDFAAVESLARGGLGEAWGAVAPPYLPVELQRSGLDPDEMRPHYEAIAARIGISGTNDDLAEWRGSLSTVQPPLAVDGNATAMLARYATYRARIRRRGFRVGRAMMAVLTEPLGDRAPNPLLGMDFWANHGGSVFRPSLMLAELLRNPRFTYRPGELVTRFQPRGDQGVEVESRPLGGGEPSVTSCRRLVLAAGTLGTTRIVLRSLDRYDEPVPLVCNEHAYIPSIRLRGLGRAVESDAHSLAQLTMVLDPSGDQAHLVQAQSYSFTGLQLVRLVKESPLAYRESLRIFRVLAGSFVILVVQHEDEPGPTKQCRLRRAESVHDDVLDIQYAPTASETATHVRNERRMAGLLRRLGCWPIRMVHPGPGSSVHYGGTLPNLGTGPLSTDAEGRLRATPDVYIADGASLPYLPAKGLTFTLMANARRIAATLAREL